MHQVSLWVLAIAVLEAVIWTMAFMSGDVMSWIGPLIGFSVACMACLMFIIIRSRREGGAE